MQRLLCPLLCSLLSPRMGFGVPVSTPMCQLTPPVARLVVRQRCWPRAVGLGLALMLLAPYVCLLLGVEFIPSGAAPVAGRRPVSVRACRVKKEFPVCSAQWREPSTISPTSPRRLSGCSRGSMTTPSIPLPGEERWKKKLRASRFESA